MTVLYQPTLPGLPNPRRVRTKDDLCTPIEVLERVRKVNRIALDPCSNEWSTVGARAEWSRDDGIDGLARPWRPRSGLVYANPPYSRGYLNPWAQKIVREARARIEIVALTPVSVSTVWWYLLREAADARCDVDHRIAFDGGTEGTGRIDSCLWYFGPNTDRFCEAFADFGEVRRYER